jgi:hypothetical protein
MTKTNLEHYKKELGKIFYEGCGKPAAMFDIIKNNCDSNIRSRYGQAYADAILDWMAQPYKKPILDKVEREYLSAVIRPFKKMIAYIVKAQDFDDGKQCIRIILQNGDGMHFPYLNDDAMYKGMEVNKDYSLEELGL